MRLAWLLVGLLLPAACADERTTVRVNVHRDPSWTLSGYQVVVGEKVVDSDAAGELLLILPDDWADQPRTIDLFALRDGARFAHGRAEVTPRLGAEVAVEITLARLPCGDWCVAGATACDGDAVVVCEQRDEDPCLEWSDPIICPVDAPSCSLGACRPTCFDECGPGESRCDGPGARRLCGQADSDACLDWLPAAACAASETCSNGACATACVDECEAGAEACSGDGTVACDDRNADGCMEWGAIVPCAPDTTCSDGVCEACACDYPPPPTCIDGNTLRTFSNPGDCTKPWCTYPLHTDQVCTYGCQAGACRRFVAVDAGGDHTCAVKNDGTVVCWGADYYGQASPPAGSFSAVTAGHFHTCAIKTNGTLACWGHNSSGQVSPPTGTFSSISAGWFHTCGVQTDGNLACWGDDSSGQTSPPAGTFSAVAAGGASTCAIRTDGALVCWGENEHSQASPPIGEFSVVSGGWVHACAVTRTDGSLRCWGDNTSGSATPPWGTYSAVSCGGQTSCARRSDGTLVCWGVNGSGEGSPPTGVFAAVSVGLGHACAVKTDGALACWGDNTDGRASPPAP